MRQPNAASTSSINWWYCVSCPKPARRSIRLVREAADYSAFKLSLKPITVPAYASQLTV